MHSVVLPDAMPMNASSVVFHVIDDRDIEDLKNKSVPQMRVQVSNWYYVLTSPQHA